MSRSRTQFVHLSTLLSLLSVTMATPFIDSNLLDTAQPKTDIQVRVSSYTQNVEKQNRKLKFYYIAR